MQLTPILKKIEHYLVSQNSIAGIRLQKGISRAEIQQKIAHLSYSFPPEVFELYEWKNGSVDVSDDTIGDLLLFPWGIFEPLESSLKEYDLNSKEGYWGRKHFPLFTTGGGDFLLINCDQNDASYGYIFAQSHALYGDELIPKYKSLLTLLQCVLECYEKGAYSFVDGVLVEDRGLRNSIRKKYEIPNE
ncbi:SMI1/KNR4 family protein [Chitinophaga filiformis]|uniref:SMI1/KNR4 family protein n=1 Tax=Chitinophaga filiformis TaxID=104663 RepID=UPI001F28F749|nr:SMI1/KNR4 family protein [Chitinophaga filiformis]MCF6404450.1 SMI1/KNR4 family protein [Chitinophaga filiformis]